MNTTFPTQIRSGYGYYLPTRYATPIAALFVAGLSYLLGDLLNRRLDTETSLLFLASRQATGVLFASIAAGGLVAALTVKYLRTGAPEHEADSPHGLNRLTWTRFAIFTLPLVGGWIGYLILTAVQRAESITDAHHAALVWAVATAPIVASAAFGLLLGQTIKNYAAPVVTAGALYGLIIAVAGNGDEAWWGWLVPYIDDAFRGGIHLTWAAGYTAWYLGLTALFIHLATATASISKTGFRIPLRTLAIDLAAIATGLGFLYLNGASAATGTS